MKHSITDILSERSEGVKELFRIKQESEILQRSVVRICEYYWHNVFPILPTKSDIVQINR
jgi:hypothetical protein